MRKFKSKCGYVVYKTTPKECIEITNGFGICDMCAKPDKTIYLVPVLSHALCQKCYDDWNERAVFYEDDLWFEKIYIETWETEALKRKIEDWNGNKKSVYTPLGASNHTDKEREENDFYATDPIAIDKLLKVEKPSHYIWECACGDGHLAKRLKEYGFEVLSSDIIQRNYELDFVEDFLKEDATRLFNGDILTNPPYKYAKEFVLQALKRVCEGNRIYMFLKLTFLEGKSRYADLFSKYPPKKVYVFSERVMCAKNGDFETMKQTGGSAVAYAWYVWEKGYQGKTEIEWI